MWIGYYGYYSFPNQSVIHHFQTFHIFQAFNDLGPEAMHKLKKKLKWRKQNHALPYFLWQIRAWFPKNGSRYPKNGACYPKTDKSLEQLKTSGQMFRLGNKLNGLNPLCSLSLLHSICSLLILLTQSKNIIPTNWN